MLSVGELMKEENQSKQNRSGNETGGALRSAGNTGLCYGAKSNTPLVTAKHVNPF